MFSNGEYFALERKLSGRMRVLHFRSTSTMSASKPSSSIPFPGRLKTRAGLLDNNRIRRDIDRTLRVTRVSINGRVVSRPGTPGGDSATAPLFSSIVCGAWSLATMVTRPFDNNARRFILTLSDLSGGTIHALHFSYLIVFSDRST